MTQIYILAVPKSVKIHDKAPLTFRHRGAKKTLRAECNLIKRNIFTSIKHYKQLNERVSFS